MPSLQSITSPNSRGCVAIAALAVASLFGLLLIGAAASAQSDSAAAPWQLPPGEQKSLDPGYNMVRQVHQREHSESSGVPDSLGEKECGCGDSGPCSECESGWNSDGCSDCDFCTFSISKQLWARGEFLAWWGKSSNVAALATTSPTGTSPSQAGILPGATVLIGNDGIDQGFRPGGRLTLGWWMTPCQDDGIEITYLSLGSKTASFLETSADNPILARPFYDAQAFRQNAVIVAFPNQQTGTINVDATNDLNTLEVLFRQAMFRDCNRRFDFLYGYRYGRFNENLSIGSSTTFISSVGQIPVGTVIQVSDLFEAKNEFNGAEVGFAAKTRYCRWSLELLAKLALGSTRSQVNVNGSTVTSVPGQTPVTSPGGFLALPTNMGTRSENNLSVMPELGVTLGYDITCRWTATFGYSFLYWSKVARPEDQIDTNLNPSQFPPGALSGFPAPQSKYITTDYWAQGLNFGLEYRF